MNIKHYHDVLIVLGYSHDFKDPTVCQRCDLAAEIFQAGGTAQILLSGGYLKDLDIKPIRSQAEAMRYALTERDVPASCLLMEETSNQLLENLYFCKTEFLLPCSWFDVGIVTSSNAIATTHWLASKILGRHYAIEVYPAIQPGSETIAIDPSDQTNLIEAEATYNSVQNGDHQTMKEINFHLNENQGK
jgi:uncharacterized SAM-binding protein YcdF (DUF218 family)